MSRTHAAMAQAAASTAADSTAAALRDRRLRERCDKINVHKHASGHNTLLSNHLAASSAPRALMTTDGKSARARTDCNSSDCREA